MFQRKSAAERHVLVDHYGLARLNDTNNEFDDREMLASYKAAIRILKTLRCFKCHKSFSSALGLKCHHDVCGFTDEELRRKCEVCGSMLKFRSMKSHMDIHRREETQRELQERALETGLEQAILAESRPVRKSAKKANEFLKSTAEYDDSDFEYRYGKKKKRRRDSNVDFYMTDSGPEETDSTASSGSEASDAFGCSRASPALFKLSISTEKIFLLYKLWKSHIRPPAAIAEKVAGLNENTGFKCDLCEQMFANHELLTFHYSKCDNSLDSNWSCGVCDFVADSDLVILLRHLMERHMTVLTEMPSVLYESLMPKPDFKRPRYGFSGPPHVIEAEIFHRTNFAKRTFLDWIIDEQSINFLDEHEQERYLPQRKSSARFKIKLIPRSKQELREEAEKKAREENQAKSQEAIQEHQEERQKENQEKSQEKSQEKNQQASQQENNHEDSQDEEENDENLKWQQLNLFESIESSTKQHTTIYTGGPVYAGAWCPYPIRRCRVERPQILCLATNVENRVFNVLDCSSHPGVLQFWNFGELKYNQAEETGTPENVPLPTKKPKLEFMIAHDYGTILEMVWCPGGTSYFETNRYYEDGLDDLFDDDDQDEVQNGRLGLLALACSDGFVRILAIPRPEDLNRMSPGSEIKMFKCQPIAVLDRHPIGLSVMGKPTICKSLSWSCTDGQRQLAVGYGNGLISLFDLQTSSSLLKKLSPKGVIQLKPRKTWIAHGAIINSLKWVPISGCSYLVSASFDRHVKIWCLDDMGEFLN